MRKYLILMIFSLFAWSCSDSGTSPSTPLNSDLLPLKTGNEWNYKEVIKNSTKTETIISLKNNLFDLNLNKYDSVYFSSNNMFYCLKDSILYIGENYLSNKIDPQIFIDLKNYNNSFSLNSKKNKTSFYSGKENIKINNSIYSDCLVFKDQKLYNLVYKIVFKPGTGIILESETNILTGEVNYQYELQNFKLN